MSLCPCLVCVYMLCNFDSTESTLFVYKFRTRCSISSNSDVLCRSQNANNLIPLPNHQTNKSRGQGRVSICFFNILLYFYAVLSQYEIFQGGGINFGPACPYRQRRRGCSQSTITTTTTARWTFSRCSHCPRAHAHHHRPTPIHAISTRFVTLYSSAIQHPLRISTFVPHAHIAMSSRPRRALWSMRPRRVKWSRRYHGSRAWRAGQSLERTESW